MESQKQNKEKLSYKNATGVIEYTLKSDIVFHYTLQKSEKALKGLVCALRGIKPSEVRSITVENPIDLNHWAKETVMDLKLTLNSGVIMNVELQMYTDPLWIQRSILYLCRAYDCIKAGDDYLLLKPTAHYCITDQELLPDEPEFYSQYMLLNTKNHKLYSDHLGINVLQLNHIDMATQEDIDNDLVYWAKLFKAATWEEMKALVQDHTDMEEVADLILELNTDNQAKEMLEGQRRYREQMATLQEAQRREKEAQKQLAEKESQLATMSDEIAALKQLLKEHGIDPTIK